METIRLQKFMAECGIASRRKCEEYITNGLVKVNGQIVTELGTKIDPEADKVEVENNTISFEEVKPENKVYILLNKPVRICDNSKR